MITIGMRAHDLGTLPLETLAARLKARGISSIQLAINKALKDIRYTPGCMSPGYARHIRQTLEQAGVHIAVLGAYGNLIHPDPAKREQALAVYREHLCHSRDFGCALVGSETGHRSSDGSPDPETQSEAAFRDLIASVRNLADCAEKQGAMAGIEPVADKHPLSSIERTERLLREVDSPALRIIFDPVNLIPSEGIGDLQDFLRSAFEAFGPAMAVIHAKDFAIRDGRKVGDLSAGTGEMDYPFLMSLIRHYKPGIHVLLENTGPGTLDRALQTLRES